MDATPEDFMRFPLLAYIVPALLACGLAAGAAAQPAEAAPGDFVVICPIEGEINDGVSVVVQRAVREAQGAAGLVFVIDTPGGRVDSAIDITGHILGAGCPTVAYIKGMGAISAGALISYACDTMVMDPTSNIGASTPVALGVETTEAMDEKSNSFVRAKYRALGEAKGHNPLLGEAMVDAEIELRGYRDSDSRYVIFKVIDEQAVESSSVGGGAPDSTPAPPPAPLPMATPDLERLVRELLGERVNPAPPPAEGAESPATPPTVSDLEPGLELISARGSLLTLTPQEAVKFGLVERKAGDLDEVLAWKGWGELRRVEITPQWDEALFAFLTSPMIAGLLLMCGIGGIYVEIRTPGFGIPGLVGLLCMATFFGSHLVVGMADWVDVLLVALGFGLLAIEVFVLPGFGIVGASGVLCIAAGVYLALTRVPIPQYSWDFSRLADAGQTVSTATLLLAVFAVATWKYLPKTALWRSITNDLALEIGEGYTVQGDPETRGVVGLRGVATTMLRPAGRGRFDGKTYDVMTRGEFLPEGTPLRIIEAEGNRYVVAPAPGDETP
jgi:membrane-bound serine protease (ClpP class)